MNDTLPNCWEITGCGRENEGVNMEEFGECIASREKLGHSCLAIAGTLCGGEVQGSVAQKIGFCTSCGVHKLYNRSRGEKGQEVIAMFPEEESKYITLMLQNAKHSTDPLAAVPAALEPTEEVSIRPQTICYNNCKVD